MRQLTPSAYCPTISMKISIITPSFNQARFLPFNLESVWNQSLEPCEQIILDPGSKDGSREIARRHRRARLVAEPDTGQANAICRGFREAKGDVLAWLNSDDMYAGPDVFAAVAERFNAPDRPDVVYGLVDFIDESNAFVKKGYINGEPSSLIQTFHHQVGILQPGVFLKREVFESVGGPPEDMEFTVDYEYWVRIALAGFKWGYLPKLLAHHRWWSEMKTASRRDESYLEHLKTVKKHFGYVHHKWAERYAECLVAGTDGIIVPVGGDAVAGQREAIRQKSKQLLEEFNTDFDSLRVLMAPDAPPPVKETARAMEAMGISLVRRGRPFASVPGAAVTGFVRSGDTKRPVAWRRYFAVAGADKLTGYEVGDSNWLFNRESVAAELDKARSQIQFLGSSRRRDICVIVGNGPTLNRSDLSLLDRADVIISNFAFYSKILRSQATYFTTVNRLVAEQGCHEINHLHGPSKFFPLWLGSHLCPAEDTFFLDANLRAEFSTDITDWISWRSTVTFFNLQLAFGLGYRKVVMIGFDHHYQQPDAAREADLIEQRTEDTNHFDPNYFRGKTWQAADVGNMEQSYLLAKAAYEAAGREIVNCTVGGRLEVFRRGDLARELGAPRAPAKNAPAAAGSSSRSATFTVHEFPRLLMIDSTPLGSLSATGQLKKIFLGDWPAENFLQIWENHGSAPTLHATRMGESIEQSSAKRLTIEEAVNLCRAFRPDAIYYRPVDYPLLTQAAEKIIGKTDAPFAIHIMDDWPERLREKDPEMFGVLDASLRKLIDRASVRWSICDAMSDEYLSRYGQRFEALANGVDLDTFPARGPALMRDGQGIFRLRYLGGLSRDMTFQSVMDIAHAVSELRDTVSIQFEIHTMDWFRSDAERATASLLGVQIHSSVSGEPYYKLLAESDALVVAYNFDPASIRYVRLSMANKMPECLASGAALLAYGPPEVATISYLQKAGCVRIVERRDRALLKRALNDLATDCVYKESLVARGREFAARHLSRKDVERRFREGIVKTAASAALRREGDSLLASCAGKTTSSSPVFEHTKQFAKRNQNQWLLTHDAGAKQQMLIANFKKVKAKGKKVIALVVVESDQRLKVNLTLGRTGNTAYEGSGKEVVLTPNQPQTFILRHQFKEEHLGVKVQVDAKDCAAPQATISIEHCALLPSTNEALASVPKDSSLAREANQHFREKRYAQSAVLYLAAARALGLKTFEFNARLSLRRLGISDEALISDLLARQA
jgi:GT2 family glycosyltransferase/glycosyltransferase involved in cell wall biosynthesis